MAGTNAPRPARGHTHAQRRGAPGGASVRRGGGAKNNGGIGAQIGRYGRARASPARVLDGARITGFGAHSRCCLARRYVRPSA